MSSSRKKSCCDEMPLFSVTQKLRQNPHLMRSGFKRPCCEKQNWDCRDSKQGKQLKQGKSRDQNKSVKKQRRKKYLQEEVEKMIQRKYFEDDGRLNAFREHNTNELLGLKDDLKQMKDVLCKLTVSDKKVRRQSPLKNEFGQQKKDIEGMVMSYKNRVDELQNQLEIQRQINMKLEQAHIQSQLYAKQTADFSESIKHELSQLSSRHMHCGHSGQKMQEKDKIINNLEYQLQSIREQNQNLLLKLSKQKQKNDILQNGLKQLQLYKDQLQDEKIQLSKQLDAQITNMKQKIKSLLDDQNQLQEKYTQYQRKLEIVIAEKQDISSKRQTLQGQLSKIKNQLSQASADLGNTKSKLCGLGSMQKKCEQLYDQIKKERVKWDQFNQESIQDKKKLQEMLNNLKAERGELSQQLREAIEQKQELIDEQNRLKMQNQRLFEDKIKMAKQNKELQLKLDEKERQISQIQQLRVTLIEKIGKTENYLKQKENDWQKERIKIETRNQMLQKQKRDIQLQVNGTLEAVRKRYDEIQLQNSQLKRQIQYLKDECEDLIQLKQQNNRLTTNCQQYNSTITNQHQKMNELQLEIQRKKDELERAYKSIQQFQRREKQYQADWQNRYGNLKEKLEECKSEIVNWREKFEKKEEQISFKISKIQAMENEKDELMTDRQKLQTQKQMICTSRSNIELQMKEMYSRLKKSQSVQLELSSQLMQLQSSTRRKEEILMQENKLFQSELSMKNKCISQLKQIIKMVKNQSIRIKDEVEQYREQLQRLQASQQKQQQKQKQLTKQYETFSELVSQQLVYIKQRLDVLSKQKNELEQIIVHLRGSNFELIARMQRMGNEQDNTIQQNIEMKNKIMNLEEECRRVSQKLKEQQNKKQQTNKLIETKQYQINAIKKQLQEQRRQYQTKITQIQTQTCSTKSILQQQTNLAEELKTEIKKKQEIIEGLNARIKMFEDKRIKVINEVHSIQNQIAQHAGRNSILQEENKQLTGQLKILEEQLRVTQDRIKIILQGKNALQQQNQALEEQCQILKQDIKKSKDRERAVEQKCQNDVKQIYSICENRKGEAVNTLQEKLKQLTNQLASSVNKVNQKNEQIQSLQNKYHKIEKVLDDNHNLLAQQRGERQRLSKTQTQYYSQIQSMKIQLITKERELQTIIRDKTILKQKLSDLQSKYESLRHKYDTIQHERLLAQRQIQNQSVSLRILRQQNRNIEKVMSDQLKQRKAIIQQLINEKRILYSQLHQN